MLHFVSLHSACSCHPIWPAESRGPQIRVFSGHAYCGSLRASEPRREISALLPPPPFSPLRRRRRAGDPRHCGVPAVGAQAGGSRPTAAGARMTQARKSGDTEFPPGGRLKTAGAAVVWGLGRWRDAPGTAGRPSRPWLSRFGRSSPRYSRARDPPRSSAQAPLPWPGVRCCPALLDASPSPLIRSLTVHQVQAALATGNALNGSWPAGWSLVGQEKESAGGSPAPEGTSPLIGASQVGGRKAHRRYGASKPSNHPDGGSRQPNGDATFFNHLVAATTSGTVSLTPEQVLSDRPRRRRQQSPAYALDASTSAESNVPVAPSSFIVSAGVRNTADQKPSFSTNAASFKGLASVPLPAGAGSTLDKPSFSSATVSFKGLAVSGGRALPPGLDAGQQVLSLNRPAAATGQESRSELAAGSSSSRLVNQQNGSGSGAGAGNCNVRVRVWMTPYDAPAGAEAQSRDSKRLIWWVNLMWLLVQGPSAEKPKGLLPTAAAAQPSFSFNPKSLIAMEWVRLPPRSQESYLIWRIGSTLSQNWRLGNSWPAQQLWSCVRWIFFMPDWLWICLGMFNLGNPCSILWTHW